MARLLGICVMLILAALAGADGKFFAPEKVAQPTIPYQRALIAYEGGDQTMVVESTLNGPPGEYSWVIPLPNAPTTLEPVSSTFFEALDKDLQPNILEKNALSMLFALYFALGLLIIVWTAPHRYNFKPWLLALVMLGEAVLMLFVAIVLTGLTGPDGGGCKKSDSADGAAGGVEVLESKVVGSYQVDVVRGSDAGPLVAWLRKNGTPLPPEAKEVVEHYAKKSWCFMAVKLDPHQGGSKPQHPIKAVFPLPGRKEPIYPMRLTGLTTQPLVLDLYVMGRGTASVTGAEGSSFELWACQSVDKNPIDGLTFRDGKRFVSRLRGELDPTDMQADLTIGFDRGEESRLVVYNPLTGANLVAQQTAMWFSITLGALALVFVGRLKSTVKWLVVASLIAGVVAAGVVRATMTVVDTEIERKVG